MVSCTKRNRQRDGSKAREPRPKKRLTAHDYFQMVVGEIGRDRREYLYEMSYCDILLIIRGYRRRNVLQYQLQRLQAFHSLFAMRENKDGKTPDQLWPLYFDRYITQEKQRDLPSSEEIQDILAEIDAINQTRKVAT